MLPQKSNSQLATYSKDNFKKLWKTSIPNDAVKVAKSDSKPLSSYTRETGNKDFAIYSVCKFLEYLRLQIQAKTNIPEVINDQMKDMAEIVYSEYYFLSIVEYKFVAREMIKGKYGEVYNLNVPFICKGLSSYADTRHSIRIKMRPEKEESKGVPMPLFVKEFADKLPKAKTDIQSIENKDANDPAVKEYLLAEQERRNYNKSINKE